jgi:hypothetical protein
VQEGAGGSSRGEGRKEGKRGSTFSNFLSPYDLATAEIKFFEGAASLSEALGSLAGRTFERC